MKKSAQLRLHRETLRLLTPAPLRQAAGGSDLGLCLSDLPGMCDPSVQGGASWCPSVCLECPVRPSRDECQ